MEMNLVVYSAAPEAATLVCCWESEWVVERDVW